MRSQRSPITFLTYPNKLSSLNIYHSSSLLPIISRTASEIHPLQNGYVPLFNRHVGSCHTVCFCKR